MPIRIRNSNLHDDPEAQQVLERLKSVCQLAQWPCTAASPAGDQLLLRPWGEGEPPIRAFPARLTVVGPAGRMKVGLLDLSLQGAIPQEVGETRWREISKLAGGLGVSAAMEGPECVAAKGDEARDAFQADVAGRAWERLTLSVVLPGHALNAECLDEMLVLLQTASWGVCDLCSSGSVKRRLLPADAPVQEESSRRMLARLAELCTANGWKHEPARGALRIWPWRKEWPTIDAAPVILHQTGPEPGYIEYVVSLLSGYKSNKVNWLCKHACEIGSI